MTNDKEKLYELDDICMFIGSKDSQTPALRRYMDKKASYFIKIYEATGSFPSFTKSRKSNKKNKTNKKSK